MILRTPIPRKRQAETSPERRRESPVFDRRIVPYGDPAPVSSFDPSDHLVCTYQCRQMVKSEFLLALESAEKQVVEYQSKLETQNEKLCLSEEERRNSRDQLAFIKQELNASKGREQALQERVLKEVADFQERYRTQVKRCFELEAEVKKEVDFRKTAESLAASFKDKISDLEGELKRLTDSAARERGSLQRELSHLQDESKLSVRRITTDLERTRSRASNSEKESRLLNSQLGDLREQLNECRREKTEIEHKLSRLCTTSCAGTNSEEQNLVKLLQEELRSYEAEVLEARRLKSFSNNNELLKEKLLEEKRHREKAEMELMKLQEIQIKAEKLEEELNDWKSLLTKIPNVSSYDDIPDKVASLQREAIESMLKVGNVSAQLKSLEVSLEFAETCQKNAEKDSIYAKARAENLVLEVKRLELLLSSAIEERDRLRSNAAKQKSGDEENGVTILKDLELAVAAKENAIRELENCLDEQRDIITRQHEELKIMNENLSFEARKVKSLERESDRLRSEVSLLESKLGHGDYSSTNTKVLRMVNTLAVDSEAKYTIEALQAELQRTQAKLQLVEELKGNSDAGQIMDEGISEKLAELKARIATLEKREERYKAVFQDKISVFRRACSALFGYKIIMDDQQRPNGIPLTRFTLQSIYAESDDEKLEFDFESGNATILVNDYTSQLEISHQVEMFVRKWNSIPALTANLMIESFNRRTIS